MDMPRSMGSSVLERTVADGVPSFAKTTPMSPWSTPLSPNETSSFTTCELLATCTNTSRCERYPSSAPIPREMRRATPTGSQA